MYNGKIQIRTIDEARAFVAMTAKYPKLKIMLNSMEYSVDAHSIVGILSLDLSRPIEVVAEGDNISDFESDLEPFTV